MSGEREIEEEKRGKELGTSQCLMLLCSILGIGKIIPWLSNTEGTDGTDAKSKRNECFEHSKVFRCQFSTVLDLILVTIYTIYSLVETVINNVWKSEKSWEPNESHASRASHTSHTSLGSYQVCHMRDVSHMSHPWDILNNFCFHV